jgi:hypothetical protein
MRFGDRRSFSLNVILSLCSQAARDEDFWKGNSRQATSYRKASSQALDFLCAIAQMVVFSSNLWRRIQARGQGSIGCHKLHFFCSASSRQSAPCAPISFLPPPRIQRRQWKGKHCPLPSSPSPLAYTPQHAVQLGRTESTCGPQY